MDREATKTTRDVRAHAARVVAALVARFGDRVPEDARTLVSFWRASEGGAERAARHLIEFASAIGVEVSADSDTHDARDVRAHSVRSRAHDAPSEAFSPRGVRS